MMFLCLQQDLLVTCLAIMPAFIYSATSEKVHNLSRHETNSAITNDRAHTTRRTIVKGAAWSIPVVAAAVAAPMAAASVNNAALAFSDASGKLLSLSLLSNGNLLGADVLPFGPNELELVNGPGDISGAATITVSVDVPAGINVTLLGAAYGFGVAAFNGVNSTPAERTYNYEGRTLLGREGGFPTTTFTTTQNISVASNGTLKLPIAFGLAGISEGVKISLLANYPVTATITIGGKTLTASSTISVPVGLGIL